MIYISDAPEHIPITDGYKKCSGCHVYTSHRASPLLCFWLVFWIFQVLRTSKPKRTVTPFMYMSPPLLSPWRASGKSRLCKSRDYIRKNKIINDYLSDTKAKYPRIQVSLHFRKPFTGSLQGHLQAYRLFIRSNQVLNSSNKCHEFRSWQSIFFRTRRIYWQNWRITFYFSTPPTNVLRCEFL